ncbi:MAG: exosortase/archaeosortase family protein [Candidatus Bathycorpusculaceae bacterium]
MLKNSMLSTGSQIALGAKIAAITIFTLALFHQDLTILFSDALRSETTSHLLVIPALFTYLIYRKRKILRAVTPLQNRDQPKETRHIPLIAGILLSATAILLYWYGSYTFTPIEYHMFVLPIFVAGLSLILFNPQTLRQLLFPIAFLVFLVPPPSEILFAVGATLSVLSSLASNAIVNAVGIPSILTVEYGTPIITITRPDGTTTIPFAVDIACSGLYSLMGFLIFIAFVAYITRDKLWKKLALVVWGIPMVYLLNIIRITTILMVGYHYGEQLALQVFHLLGGWILIFIGTLLLLVAAEKILRAQIFTRSTAKCLQCNPNPQSHQTLCLACSRVLKPEETAIHKGDIIKVAAIGVCVILLMSIQAPVFALTQSPAIVVVKTPYGEQFSTEILPELSDYTLQFAYRDTEFERIAKQDMSLAYLYTPKNESYKPVWVTIEMAQTRSSLHRWEACLITWPLQKGLQVRVSQIELKDITLMESPSIIGRYFVFQYIKTNQTQAVLYWYESATFAANSTFQQEHVKISLIAYPRSLEELPQIEDQLVALAKPIISYWQPIKTWSPIAAFISEKSVYLAGGTSMLLTATVILYALETERQRKANRNAYQKLSQANRQIIDAVRETEKTTTPTLDSISSAYQKATGQSIDNEKLLQKLAELERTGTVKRQIANKHDEPIQIWKTQT